MASLLAETGYSESMCVDLIALSAYMLQVASKADSLCVAGADIAVYRDTVGPFEFVDPKYVQESALRIENGLRGVLMGEDCR